MNIAISAFALLLIVISVTLFAVTFTIAICRAAKAGDDAMDQAISDRNKTNTNHKTIE